MVVLQYDTELMVAGVREEGAGESSRYVFCNLNMKDK